MMGVGLQPEKKMEQLGSKEYMDRYQKVIEEAIQNEDRFKDATVTRRDDETIRVTTKEGYVYVITETKVEFIGKKGENVPPNLQESDIKFIFIPSEWTKSKIIVEIESKIEGYTLQYSIDGETWTNYTLPIPREENGAIYARLINVLDETGGYATGNVTNIDRLVPNQFTPTATSTSNSITLTGSTTDVAKTATDGSSGIDKYYFSKDNGETWELSAGQTGTSYTFDGLTQNQTYNLKMKAVDKAGNETITGTVSKNTGTVTGLTSSNVTFSYSPSTPTKGSVAVNIATTVTGYTLQYSTNGGTTWNNYTTAVTMSDNGAIYARLWDGTNGGAYATGNVTNIDRLAPNQFTPTATSTSNSITLTGSTTDAAKTATDGSSGINKYYFSKDNGATWEPSAGQTGTSYTFTKLTQNKSYSLKMKAVDKAGNEVITNTISKATGNVPQLTSSNTTFSYNPSTWTKGNVAVTITTTVTGYTLEYSIDGKNWNDYTSAVTMSSNGAIYARVKDSIGQVNANYATGNVTIIDKTAPTVSISTGEITSNSAKLTVTANDEQSGLATSGTYKYYLGTTLKATSTTNNYTFTDLTAETSYTLKVIVIDKVGNTTEKSTTITTEAKPITASSIANSTNKSEYYGATVNGYTCTNSAGVNEWKILYADSSNIYLIADNYITSTYTPKGKGGSSVEFNMVGGANLSKIILDYSGSSDITDSRIKALNSDYFNKGYTSTTDNMKAVAYMLDINVWNGFAGIKSEYAIGGPTIEWLFKSYNEKYGTNYQARVSYYDGYKVSKDGGQTWTDNYLSSVFGNDDELYAVQSYERAHAMWVASPAASNNAEGIIYVFNSGSLSKGSGGADNIGLRPVVCLKSNVELKKTGDRMYAIK